MSESFHAVQATRMLWCFRCNRVRPHFITDARGNGRECRVRTCLCCGEELIEAAGKTFRVEGGVRR